MLHVRALLGHTEGCCGVTQVYEFGCVNTTTIAYSDVNGQGETEEAAYKSLFDNLMNADPQEFEAESGYVMQMWFVKRCNYNGIGTPDAVFEAEPLRLLVEGIEGVLELGEFTNPNTGNIIKGYQWEQKL
jgi:hypothetical protein